MGVVKSAVGIGSLLVKGIGDTIRVSLTGDPVKEVYAAKDILRAVGLHSRGLDIISCPTCGRCVTDIEGIVNALEARYAGCEQKLCVAVMGCAVNGPGEASHADIGVACGGGADSGGVLFKHGKIVRKVSAGEMLDALCGEIDGIIKM
jgi:(E)-4-hydroxy-3-methylbut-2-enyl-diphosphate synthase